MKRFINRKNLDFYNKKIVKKMVKKRVDKSYGFYAALVISIALVAYLVWAATGLSSIIVEPTSNSNYSANFVVNITWNSTELNSTLWNMTFCYVNVSGSWTRIGWPTGNASGYNNYSLETHMYINFTQTITNITDANGLALNCTVGNMTANLSIQTANMSVRITIDDTPPNVTLSPTTNTNYSNFTTNISGVVLLNFTIKDNVIGFHNSSMYNVFFNLTKGGVQNATFNAEREASTNNFKNSTGFNLSAYAEGNYSIAVFANDSLGNLNSTTNTSIIWIDNTRPDINASNISSPVIGRNYSTAGIVGNLILNVTVRDGLTHVTNVSFVIKNGSGSTNATVSAAQEGSTSYGNSTSWSVAINTSHYPDNNYTITVFANDSAGNTNTSALIDRITFDNTAPSMTFSCSPSSVEAGGTVTCSCGGTDTVSGFNSSSLSYTANPSTTSTGTHSLTCGGYDQAGNSNSLATTYTVTGGSTGGGGGGGGGETTWTSTQAVSTEDFNTGYTQELSPKQRLQVNVNDEAHHVGVVSVTATSATIEVSSTPQRVTMSIGAEKKFDVTADGVYDMKVTLNSIANNKAEITVLSISEKIPAGEAGAAGEGAGEGEGTGGGITGALEKGSSWWIIVIIIVIVIAIVVYIIYKKRQ